MGAGDGRETEGGGVGDGRERSSVGVVDGRRNVVGVKDGVGSDGTGVPARVLVAMARILVGLFTTANLIDKKMVIHTIITKTSK